MRFWRPRVSVKQLSVAAAFAAALALAPSAAHAQFPASFDLSMLDGTNGFVINGTEQHDNSGVSVSGAGDVNGDGIDDVIIGAPFVSFETVFFFDAYIILSIGAGQSYVVFGSDSGFSSSLDLSTLDGSNGFAINGIEPNDRSGYSVSGAGDVNGDGIDDVIIGALRVDRSLPPPVNEFGMYDGRFGIGRRGQSYVVFGQSGGFSPSLDLGTLDGTNGFVINGVDRYDESGSSVSGAGDVNGDGIDDLIIGAPSAVTNGRSRAGESYVVFGNNNGFSSSLDLSALNGTNGFVINGIDSFDASGGSVSSAGDVNGDGFDDVIIGANRADQNGNSSAGESYVVFGNNSGFSSSLDLSTLDGTNGFVVKGIDQADSSGRSVSVAGDVNGDGIDDLIIGAFRAEPNLNSGAGESYVVFGQSGGFSPSLDLGTLDGSNGFVINGIDSFDASGGSVSGAGDVNGDGIDDLIIGAGTADPNGNNNAGESYVVFGQTGGFSSSLDLSTLDGSNGFVINGIGAEDLSGLSVSGAGDVNGDGFDDLIIGAPGFPFFRIFGGESEVVGESYVVFGRATFPSVLKGDVDTDGDIDFSDIAPFIAVLRSGEFQAESDCDCSTVVDFADIPAFIAILREQ